MLTFEIPTIIMKKKGNITLNRNARILHCITLLHFDRVSDFIPIPNKAEDTLMLEEKNCKLYLY